MAPTDAQPTAPDRLLVLHSEHVSLVDDHLTTVLTQHGTVIRAERCALQVRSADGHCCDYLLSSDTVLGACEGQPAPLEVGDVATVVAVLRGGRAWTRSVCRVRRARAATATPQDAPRLAPDRRTMVRS